MPVRTLSAELQQKSESKLNEVTNRLQCDIQQIQDWLSQQAHLNAIKADDQLIVAYLRGCKFSTQLVKEKLDLYYAIKTALPEYYDGTDPFNPEVQAVLASGAILPLTKTTGPSEPRIIFLRAEMFDTSKYSLIVGSKVFFMIVDILMREDDNCVVAGQTIVLDLKGLSLDKVIQITPKYIKSIAICLQHAYPIRPQHIYIINSSPIFDNIYQTIKMFVTKDIRNRIQFVKAAELCNLISKSVIPYDYGGDSTALKDVTAHWKAKVESYTDWYLQDEKCRSDESKRVDINKYADSLFGLEGSFKQLEID